LNPSGFPKGALASWYPKYSSGEFNLEKSTDCTFSGAEVVVFVTVLLFELVGLVSRPISALRS
jgi:hypothetical protein